MGQTRKRALGHAGVEGNGPWDRAVSEGAGERAWVLAGAVNELRWERPSVC